MTMQNEYEDETEAAIARRLKKLHAMPVDTTGLDRALCRQLPPSPPRSGGRWWASLTAIAATLLVVATVSFALLQGREAQASPAVMAQMHRDILSGAIPTMHADTIEEADRAIAALSGNFPQLPEPPKAHVMACCMRNIGNKKVACILLNDGGSKVTMVVADATQMQSPKSPTMVRNGVAYHVQTVNELHMVMTEREHRWVCLIGEVPIEKLMDLADAITF